MEAKPALQYTAPGIAGILMKARKRDDHAP
jgi:hypothetical protein